MLNSAEHEICPADKSQITNNCNIYVLLNIEQEMSLQINIKMPYLLPDKISCSAELSMKNIL